MARFGGWSCFGGSSKFGGGEPFWQRAYRILRTPPIAPAGLWPQDDSKLINIVLRAEAKGIGHGLVQLEALGNEIFPQSAHDTLEDWESLLGVIPADDATFAERQAAVRARSRGNCGISLPELRWLLYPLLGSTTAFYDGFDLSALSTRYTLDGNGTRTVATSVLALTVTNPVDGDWLAGNANAALLRLNDVSDGWTWRAKMTTATTGTNTATGICAIGDVDNGVMFAVGDDGSQLLRVDKIVEGEITEGVATVAVPSFPFYVQISRSRSTGLISFAYGADAANLTTLYTMENPVRALRRVGMFSRNVTASKNTVSGGFDEVQLVHETAENNVEIVEQTLYNVGLSGEAEDIFEAHVIRRTTDSGSYDIKQAQRICDSVKLGHTLLLVGEAGSTDAFLTDDPASLTDRDMLGE